MTPSIEYQSRILDVAEARAQITLLEGAAKGIRDLELEDPVLAYKVNTAVQGLDECIKELQSDLRNAEHYTARALKTLREAHG